MPFPENCIKGIPNRDFMHNENRVSPHLFYFKEIHARDDGWVEQSINWEDDESAIQFTLQQENPRHPGERQFSAGVAIVPRAKLDALIQNRYVGDHLDYERQPLSNEHDNPYHGNLLLSLEALRDKPFMKMIASWLAMEVSGIIPQENE